MAYVVRGKGKTWELRESRSTAAGPRSRTLATFAELSPDVVARANRRASRPLDPSVVERAARRAGAPVRAKPAERAARELLSELARGQRPRPVIARLVEQALGQSTESLGLSAAAQAAGAWAGATYRDRSNALVDLLLLADAIPHAKRADALRFPRIGSVRP